MRNFRHLRAKTSLYGGGGGGSQPLRAITMYNRVASNFVSVSGTSLDVKCRLGFVVGAGNGSQIVPSFYNWRTDPSGIVVPGNPLNVISAALETNSTYTPVLFSGGRTRTIASGATDIQADPITPASVGLSNFDTGRFCWWRFHFRLNNSGDLFPQGIPYEGAGGGAFPNWVGFAYDPAVNTTTGAIDGTGPISLGSAFSAITRPYFPVMLGRFVSGSPNVWLGIGDSIIQGLSDTLEGDTYGFAGYWYRSLVNAALNGGYGAGINMGSSGTTHSMWSGSNNALAKAYWAYCTAAIENYGTNNFAAGATLSAVQTDSQALWTDLRAAGINTIVRQPILPRTNSTDNWQTAGANQTGVNSAFNAGGLVAQYNTWLATQISGSGITALIDTSTLRDATNPEDWVVNGAANYATPDGVHLSTAISVLAGNAGRTAVAAYP